MGVGAALGSPCSNGIARKNKNMVMPAKNGRPKGAPTKEYNNKMHNNIAACRRQPLRNAGITLIALIITIILLLILAGVTIYFTLGENGILKNAEIAGKKYSEASVKETIQNILADMKIEEIKNGRKLDLAKIAQNLESKDNNIAITEYEEGATELKGTYTINGQEYEFTINNKFEVEVTAPTGEKIVKIEKITWEDGKPKVTLTSTQEGTIEYKDENGEWKPYDETKELNNGDTLTVRVKAGSGTTKEEIIVIKDKTVPSEFKIEIASGFIKTKAVTVNLKTTPVDNETGLKDYTYVAETNGSKKEIANVTSTSYQITELTPETSYTIYVLAYDNAGNYRKSNIVTITTPAYVPPTVSNPTEGENTIREGNLLPFTWEQLSEISNSISNNSNITNNTEEFKLAYEGNEYTIGVGDYKYLDEENNTTKIRIIGFNHDILAGQNILNEDGTLKTAYLDTTNDNNQISEDGYNNLKKAGITFEFAETLEPQAKMNPTKSNIGGWGECEMKNVTLPQRLLDFPENMKIYIKKVTKSYCAVGKSSVLSYTDDDLWCLSYIEITGQDSDSYNVPRREGKIYKYYQNIVSVGGEIGHNKKNSYAIKRNSKNNSNWWLRTSHTVSSFFYIVNYVGGTQGFYTDNYSAEIYAAPGFCI